MNLQELYISHNGIEEIEGLDNLVSRTNYMKYQFVWCSMIHFKGLDSPVTPDREMQVQAVIVLSSWGETLAWCLSPPANDVLYF